MQSGNARRRVGNQGMRLRKLLVLLPFLGAGCILVPVAQAPIDVVPVASLDQVEAFTELVNAHRRKVGCRPLAWVPPQVPATPPPSASSSGPPLWVRWQSNRWVTKSRRTARSAADPHHRMKVAAPSAAIFLSGRRPCLRHNP